MKAFLHWLLTRLYKIEITGLEHYEQAGDRVLIVANHSSFLDPLLLAVFLPDNMTFAINTRIAQRWWLRPFLHLTKVFPMDPVNPLSTKSLIRYLEQDEKVVVFPEGRITVTGTLMKIYDGSGLIADKANAQILPVRIDGAIYTPFSHMRGRVRLKWFPKIRLTLLPPRTIKPPAEIRGRARRQLAGRYLTDIMNDMMFATSNYQRTLFQSLLDARRIHGGKHIVAEDVERKPYSYDRVIMASFVLGRKFCQFTTSSETVGVLLPSMSSTLLCFMGLQVYSRVPAMLNFTVGASGMLSACQTARLHTVITSRRFIELAKLGEVAAQLGEHVRLVYLEDIAAEVDLRDKVSGFVDSLFGNYIYRNKCIPALPEDPAVVLFTSGSEGAPKAVVLSHANLLANISQLSVTVDYSERDVILNALPLFHSFGLTAGTLLPVLSGMKSFFYPSPLHYRIVPEVAYDINATVMFGTNTFLSGYARFAHPYDFYSIRYVFAGAEKLNEETRKVWGQKFGVRIFEGYGATEASPVLATNTPMHNLPGSVGQLLPGIDHYLEPVPGVDNGGRLFVRGPNIMLGYMYHDQPGKLVPPATGRGEGWYDTGDIVEIDANGFVLIRGRAKRFAKIGGEMVSLTAIEQLAATTWPDALHAAVAIADKAKGEQLILFTEQADAERGALLEQARTAGIGEISVPKKIIPIYKIPVMGTGKTDYPAVQKLAEEKCS
jgi:acyl-[acyl-carrier-protein]-phospholipid O-acyltransferase/long-chain-fatty-acid--[acyl-carrier-protein] ligase